VALPLAVVLVLTCIVARLATTATASAESLLTGLSCQQANQ
jgi:hypothetical protein